MATRRSARVQAAKANFKAEEISQPRVASRHNRKEIEQDVDPIAPAKVTAVKSGQKKGNGKKTSVKQENGTSTSLPDSDSPHSVRKKVRKRIKKEDGHTAAVTDVDTVDASTSPSTAVSILTDAEMYAFEGRSHWVGAHMSVAGGVENSIVNARLYGCQAWALFLKPKMKWDCKPLTDENVQMFKEWLPKLRYDDTRRCLPHGSYLVNLANPDDDKRRKSLDAFIDDLKRCALLGIGLYNFHPGSGVNECTRQEACQHIADSINTSHAAFGQGELAGLTCPTILLENMAGQGHQIGASFQELADVIAAVHDKSKVGVCIDTAHAFAAGYDIRTQQGYEDMMTEFDQVIGMQYLKGMHLNDSAAPLSSHRDRHANLGGGHLGLIPFHCIMNDARLQHMPLVLETPAASWRVWQGEIQALYAMQGLANDDVVGWKAIADKLAALRALDQEMEKGNSLAEGSKAARRALEGKPPPTKRNRKEKQVKKETSPGKDDATA